MTTGANKIMCTRHNIGFGFASHWLTVIWKLLLGCSELRINTAMLHHCLISSYTLKGKACTERYSHSMIST